MTNSAALQAPVVIPAPGRYRLDPERSVITFTTRHLFGLASVRGTVGLREGRILVAEPVAGSAVEARLAVATFRSGNEIRDARVLSPRLLDAEQHPSLVFTGTTLTQDPGHWLLRGLLDVCGRARPVEVQIDTASADGSALRITGQAAIDRYAFGIAAYRGLAARWLRIGLDLLATPESDR
jgi:polyisoprenoid-binding protein YceI